MGSAACGAGRIQVCEASTCSTTCSTGRDAAAATDITMRAEMLSYSRSRGIFAGVSLEGSTLRPDGDANKRLYGKDVTAEDIVEESRLSAPDSAHALISRLQKASPTLKP